MIIGTSIYYSVSGRDFIPTLIEDKLGFTFSEISLRGDYYKKSHRKGEKIEISTATISFRNEKLVQDNLELIRIVELAIKIQALADDFKIEDSSFDLSYNYAAQCGLSFCKQELKTLSKLNFININCYMVYDTYETKKLENNKELILFSNNGSIEKEVEIFLEDE